MASNDSSTSSTDRTWRPRISQLLLRIGHGVHWFLNFFIGSDMASTISSTSSTDRTWLPLISQLLLRIGHGVLGFLNFFHGSDMASTDFSTSSTDRIWRPRIPQLLHRIGHGAQWYFFKFRIKNNQKVPDHVNRQYFISVSPYSIRGNLAIMDSCFV